MSPIEGRRISSTAQKISKIYIVWEMIGHSIHVKAMQARKAAIFTKEVGILEVIFEGD